MFWLAAHMWFLLIAAFAVGVAVGWWIWGKQPDSPVQRARDEAMGSLALDFTDPGDEEENKAP